MSAFGPKKYDFSSVQKVYDFLYLCLYRKTETFDAAAKKVIANSRQFFNLDFSKVVDSAYGTKSTLMELAVGLKGAEVVEFLCSQGVKVNLYSKDFSRYSSYPLTSLLQRLVYELSNAIRGLDNERYLAMPRSLTSLSYEQEKGKAESLIKIIEILIGKTDDITILTSLNFSELNKPCKALQINVANGFEKVKQDRLKELEATLDPSIERWNETRQGRVLSFRSSAIRAATPAVKPASAEEIEQQLRSEIQRIELQVQLERLQASKKSVRFC
ncbi:MAG: hypothetical protein HYX61_10165 [Gammaproteobacteria bacterium]|jgi:hypothetical protein|nr:hypothetical protein [Gammaproteobacteria bacterium]